MVSRAGSLGALAVASFVAACGPPVDGPPECLGFAGCSNPEPRPGFAKFAVGRADAVRWSGVDGCDRFDLQTGKEGDDGLIKVQGEAGSNPTCDRDDGNYGFVYRQHSKELSAESWTTAYRPLDVLAAWALLRNCTSESRPEASALVGHWWRANNTYAENRILDYIAPTTHASRLLPFDDDGIERLGEEVLDGVATVQFRNAAATVWMIAGAPGDRPARVTRNNGSTDVRFTDWDVPFEAAIPAEMQELSEVCETQ